MSRPRLQKGWSSEDDSKLIALRDEGFKPPEIAKVLGRPVESVQQRLMGITLRKKLCHPER